MAGAGRGEREPARPAYILRGHASTVHALCFWRGNAQLASGDAEGWVVGWDIALRRPAAAWRAHDAMVLGIEAWGAGRLLTHGRDGKVCVWQLSLEDEAGLSQDLPVDIAPGLRPRQPWLLHMLDVAALTFCAFSTCPASGEIPSTRENADDDVGGSRPEDALLVAVAADEDAAVDVLALPSGERRARVAAPAQPGGLRAGMSMAVKLFWTAVAVADNITSHELRLVVGYESGRTHVFREVASAGQKSQRWETIYTARPHEQPVLSLDVVPPADHSRELTYFTSGADAVIAKHLLAEARSQDLRTGHAGQQGLRVRSDGRVCATAGWDGRARVYACKAPRELAVLKFHRQGCYVVAFADVLTPDPDDTTSNAARGGMSIQPASTSQTMTTAQARDARARQTHWLAVGSKDCKISLWDIY